MSQVPHGCRKICDTINPENPDGDKVEIFIELGLIHEICKHPIKFYNLGMCVPGVLTNPMRIYSGLRDLQKGGWCYVGVPDQWCIKDGVFATFPRSKFVFAVYVNPRMRVYEWRAEKIAADDAFAPVDWQRRYGELIWQTS